MYYLVDHRNIHESYLILTTYVLTEIRMGIPQKKEPKGAENLVKEVGKVVDSIPGAFKEIPNLPKLKLLKLTGIFFFLSTGIWFMQGPWKRLKIQRRIREAEIIYQEGIRESSSMTGTEKPYSEKYAFDYREAIDRAKEQTSEKEPKS